MNSDNISIENRNLKYKLNIIVGLFFLFPVLGFLYFAVKYDILSDQDFPIFLLGVLFFSFFGMILLRGLFDRISIISKTISSRVIDGFSGEPFNAETDELRNLIRSFNLIENQFSNTFGQLKRKVSEISILKELSELCYVTFDPEEILSAMLERAMTLTGSDIGSVMTLEQSDARYFIVKASIGQEEHIRIGDHIDFDTSIAKYAVINKLPLVVEDIEEDRRFGRANLVKYGTKSFVCMPIKTSKTIVGVVTLSRKADDSIYHKEDVEVLVPLLSNAAFTYENLRLIRENENSRRTIQCIHKIFSIICSSFRETELLHSILGEMQTVVDFSSALLFTCNDGPSNTVVLSDLMSRHPLHSAKGDVFPYRETVIGKAVKQETTIVVEDCSLLKSEVERNLFPPGFCQGVILVPLKVDGRVRGIFALTGDGRCFSEAQNFIEWVAAGLGLAQERNRLSAAVFKRDQEMDSIRQIGSALASSTFEQEHVLNYTMDMIREVMNVEAGSMLMVVDDQLHFAVGFNLHMKSLEDFRLQMGQGIAGYVASRGASVLTNDAPNSPHFFSGIDEKTGFNTKSALCVPMISQGKVIGVIEVLNKIPGAFNISDRELLQSIAASMSIAIENARLYKETVTMAEHERSIRRLFQKFVPKEVLEKILHGAENGQPIMEELKTVTLMNIDLRGFSSLTHEIGPQKTVSLLNNFFSVMGEIVFTHHGIVDKYLGDGFLAIFGAPVSSTLDADNALNAGMEMKAAVATVNRHFETELGTSVRIGISIHTGEVVVGNIGFEKKMDYTVIGGAVNTVFRMQELTKAIPNSIVIGEKTLRASRLLLEVREMDNRLGDLRVYELLGRKNLSA